MIYEKSCGGVLFTHQDNTIKYLIIRHLGGHCGFPKGHMEAGETEEQTAIREIWEEVGLTVSLIDGFRMEDIYPLPNKPDTHKQVVYFLAEFSGQCVHTQAEEIAAAYLLPYEDALALIPFPEAKRILTEAHQFISKNMK